MRLGNFEIQFGIGKPDVMYWGILIIRTGDFSSYPAKRGLTFALGIGSRALSASFLKRIYHGK